MSATKAIEARGTTALQVDGAAAIAHWGGAWRQLERRAACANPFVSYDWIASWTQTQPQTVQPRLFAERFADGSLAGLLACQYARRGGLRCLELAGQGSGGDALDCLVDPEADDDLPGRLLRAALAAPGWDRLRLESVAGGGHLARAFAQWGGGIRKEGEWLPYLPLPPSFEALLLRQSANFREQLRRRRRQLARAFPAFAVRCLRGAAEIETGMEHLFRLHNARRRAKQGRGIFESLPICAFHRCLARRWAQQDRTRLYLLHLNGEPAAALYGFVAGAEFYFFQSGLDSAAAEVGAGAVLMGMVIEDCIAQGLRQFEFLRGDEEYKSRWTDLHRRSLELEAWRGWRGHGYRRMRGLARDAKALLRIGTPRTLNA